MAKCLIALAITCETSVRRVWISQQLHMGATAGVTRYTTKMADSFASDRKMKRHYAQILKHAKH